MGYPYQTTIEHIVAQAEIGVQPALREMLAKRLQEAADEALAKAKADIDQAIKDVAYKIADGLEAHILSARSPTMSDPDFVIHVNIRDKRQQRFTPAPEKSRVE
jgi:hypothetical protein